MTTTESQFEKLSRELEAAESLRDEALATYAKQHGVEPKIVLVRDRPAPRVSLPAIKGKHVVYWDDPELREYGRLCRACTRLENERIEASERQHPTFNAPQEIIDRCQARLNELNESGMMFGVPVDVYWMLDALGRFREELRDKVANLPDVPDAPAWIKLADEAGDIADAVHGKLPAGLTHFELRDVLARIMDCATSLIDGAAEHQRQTIINGVLAPELDREYQRLLQARADATTAEGVVECEKNLDRFRKMYDIKPASKRTIDIPDEFLKWIEKELFYLEGIGFGQKPNISRILPTAKRIAKRLATKHIEHEKPPEVESNDSSSTAL